MHEIPCGLLIAAVRDSFQVDHVALQLFSSGDGARGSVNAPSKLTEGIPTVFEPDLPASEAARHAADYAAASD